jgi:hypothetical protein
MEKVKKESVKIVKPNTVHTIKVLGETVYIMENQSILRIGHTSKTIEGNRMFSLLDKKIQEFMVHLVLCLLKTKKESNNKYLKADKMALDFIVEKYPKKSKEFWYSAFKTVLISTGVLVAVVVIGELVAMLYRFVTGSQDAEAATRNLTNALEEQQRVLQNEIHF